MPVTSSAIPGPSKSKKMVAELEAELAAMEEEEAAETTRKQACKEKKKWLTELAEAKKVEEAVAAAAAEMAQKATLAAKKAGKWQAEELAGKDEGDEACKRKRTDEDEAEGEELARVACCRCVIYFYPHFPF